MRLVLLLGVSSEKMDGGAYHTTSPQASTTTTDHLSNRRLWTTPPPHPQHQAAFYWAAIESKRVRDVFVKWTGIVIVTWFSNCCRSCIMYLQINRWILLLQKNCFIYLCETGGKGNTTIILPDNNKRYSMILDNTKWYLTCRLISATSSIMRLPSRRITCLLAWSNRKIQLNLATTGMRILLMKFYGLVQHEKCLDKESFCPQNVF